MDKTGNLMRIWRNLHEIALRISENKNFIQFEIRRQTEGLDEIMSRRGLCSQTLMIVEKKTLIRKNIKPNAGLHILK